jgi:hypothetical protein
MSWLRMSAFFAAALALCGCDRKRSVGGEDTTPTPPPDAAPEGRPALTEVTVLSWDLIPGGGEPPTTRVVLQRTFETGAREPYELGTFDGACTVWKPAPDPNDPYAERAVTGIDCWHAGAGDRLRLVRQMGGELIVVRAQLDEMVDEISYEEYDRVKIRPGARLDVAP